MNIGLKQYYYNVCFLKVHFMRLAETEYLTKSSQFRNHHICVREPTIRAQNFQGTCKMISDGI